MQFRTAVALVLVFVLSIAGCTQPVFDRPATGGETPRERTGTQPERTTPRQPASTTTAPGTPPANTPNGTLSAGFVVGGERRATVVLEVADSPAERRRGLMYRRSLPANRGMVFVFPDEAPRTFWMKNTYVPLDMIFVAANGTVLNVEHATPQPDATVTELRRYRSDGPARYVIEVNRGFANRTGIGPGARVVFDTPNPPTPARDGSG